MKTPLPPTGGSCSGHPVHIWYPNLNVYEQTTEELRAARQDMATAKTICSSCKIKTDCLEYALSWERHGIWGGTTENDRAKMRKERGIELLRPGVMALGIAIGSY